MRRTRQSTGGRKPVMLELKPGSYYAVGFDIGMNELKMVIADITSEILVQKRVEIQSRNFDRKSY